MILIKTARYTISGDTGVHYCEESRVTQIARSKKIDDAGAIRLAYFGPSAGVRVSFGLRWQHADLLGGP